MSENPYIIDQIRHIAYRPRHDLHQYINFDDGPPTHLFQCPHSPRWPTDAQWKRRQKRGVVWLGNQFLQNECPRLSQEFIIYGRIGHGTFGVVFAARTRHEVDGRFQHYAIKVQLYVGYGEGRHVGYLDRDPQNHTSATHREAAILNCLRGNDRVSQIHSAYLHEAMAYIVMNQFSVDYDPEMDTLPQIQNMAEADEYPAFQGTGLLNDSEKAGHLGEPQVRKVVSHLLEALMFLNDRRMTHQDLSHRNYLVDEDLNVQLIDFDVDLTVNPKRYKDGYYTTYIPALEDRITPELCAWLLDEDPDAGANGQLEFHVRDVRDEPLWRLGVIMFQLLHGYSPWESPNFSAPKLVLSGRLSLAQLTRHREYRDDRRRRMINEPVQISDKLPLTQDCIDVLKAMLANDVEDRPSIEELVAFPWFQGSYLDGGDDFIRPERENGD